MTSNAEVDRLGDRLRHDPIAESDLIALEEYRQSFQGAYDLVMRSIQATVSVAPTGRPAKTTQSIVAKLRRETVRLSQMQDIAGCRIVVDRITGQDAALEVLLREFSAAHVDDRRTKPSHGYRAVHVICKNGDRPVEIQIRTAVQHQWAELSEKLSDLLDPEIKYGGGPSWAKEGLSILSSGSSRFEYAESQLVDAEARLAETVRQTNTHQEAVSELERVLQLANPNDARLNESLAQAQVTLEKYRPLLEERREVVKIARENLDVAGAMLVRLREMLQDLFRKVDSLAVGGIIDPADSAES